MFLGWHHSLSNVKLPFLMHSLRVKRTWHLLITSGIGEQVYHRKLWNTYFAFWNISLRRHLLDNLVVIFQMSNLSNEILQSFLIWVFTCKFSCNWIIQSPKCWVMANRVIQHWDKVSICSMIWFKCQWRTHLNVSLKNSDERFPGKINVFEPGPMKQL